jgi:hypothetical protein
MCTESQGRHSIAPRTKCWRAEKTDWAFENEEVIMLSGEDQSSEDSQAPAWPQAPFPVPHRNNSTADRPGLLAWSQVPPSQKTLSWAFGAHGQSFIQTLLPRPWEHSKVRSLFSYGNHFSRHTVVRMEAIDSRFTAKLQGQRRNVRNS